MSYATPAHRDRFVPAKGSRTAVPAELGEEKRTAVQFDTRTSSPLAGPTALFVASERRSIA